MEQRPGSSITALWSDTPTVMLHQQPEWVDLGTVYTVEELLERGPQVVALSADETKAPQINLQIVELLLDMARRLPIPAEVDG